MSNIYLAEHSRSVECFSFVCFRIGTTTVTRRLSVIICQSSSSCSWTPSSSLLPFTRPAAACSPEMLSQRSAFSLRAPWAEQRRSTPFMNLHCGSPCTQQVASQRSLRLSLSTSWKHGWELVWPQILLAHLLASSLERNWLGLAKVFKEIMLCLILNSTTGKTTVAGVCDQMSSSLVQWYMPVI